MPHLLPVPLPATAPVQGGEDEPGTALFWATTVVSAAALDRGSCVAPLAGRGGDPVGFVSTK
jgi:hypothetical protein